MIIPPVTLLTHLVLAIKDWAAESIASGSVDYSELARDFCSGADDDYESAVEVRVNG